MQIISYQLFTVATPPPHHGGSEWLFVKLITDAGIVGWGEAYWIPTAPAMRVALLNEHCERWLLDSDPHQIERQWQESYSCEFTQRPDLGRMACVSACEMACWDIIGKAAGQPIYNLLGGRYHARLRSYTYLYPDTAMTAHGETMSTVQETPALAAERAQAYVEMGFTAIKLDPIGFGSGKQAPWILSPLELRNAEMVVRQVREAVGDHCDILLGTHGQMTTESAIHLGQRLEQYDLLWFEEPVTPDNPEEMGRVAQAVSIPIAAGERLTTKFEFAALLRHHAAAILQPNLGRVGGILEAKKIAGMAETQYAKIAPHLWCGPLVAAASLQLDACSPNFLVQESIERFDNFHSTLLKEPFTWENGYLIPSERPGLGYEPDERQLHCVASV